MVYYDASCEGLRCILIWHDRVIAYTSRKLKLPEKNYLNHNLELLAMICLLQIWHYYPHGVYVDIFYSHKILQFVFTQKEFNLRKKRWLDLLKNYDINLHYHLGKDNVVPNAFSRLSKMSLAHVDKGNKNW